MAEIKEAHIDALREQMRIKLVLAERVAKLKFLIPALILDFIKAAKPELSEDALASLSDEAAIDLMDELHFGDSEIDAMVAAFPELFDLDELHAEWRSFRHKLVSGHRNQREYKPFYESYLRRSKWKSQNPNLATLVTILVVVALSSCNTERAFSAMNFIKFWLTNRLQISLVSDIMSLKECGWTMDEVVGTFGKAIITKFQAIKPRRGPYAKGQ